MKAEIEFVTLPYSSAAGNSMVDVLIREFANGKWSHFKSAVAFAKQSGNVEELLQSMEGFLAAGNYVEMTFGADKFSGNSRGSELEAVETLLDRFGAQEGFKLYLYHEKSRAFHPKIYLFSNVAEKTGLFILGSSNWGFGGLVDNIEANVIVKLDLQDAEHQTFYDNVNKHFVEFWQEAI
ncbi:MAG: phospholipase D family protein [Trichlorobacter sp.]